MSTNILDTITAIETAKIASRMMVMYPAKSEEAAMLTRIVSENMKFFKSICPTNDTTEQEKPKKPRTRINKLLKWVSAND